MAQTKFGSAGVSSREIDLTGPVTVEPSGIPACVISTFDKGVAYVPTTFGTVEDFDKRNGPSDGQKYGPLAVYQWLKNAGSVTTVRVLGVGDGKRRSTSTGDVTSAGFIVGEQQPNSDSGLLIQNPYANYGGPLGRTYFLGCFMSESNGSQTLSSAGLQGGSNTQFFTSSVPLVRGILMAPSGVIMRLSTSFASTLLGSDQPASSYIANINTCSGSTLGCVVLKDGTKIKQEFTLLLNGHKGIDSAYPNMITASFDMTSQNYFANVFNRDPFKIQEAGHYLYSHYDIHPSQLVLTGTNLIVNTLGADAATAAKSGVEPSVFLITGSSVRDSGTAYVPNYENFSNRFTHGKTPWVISQKFGGKPKNLFRLHALDSGVAVSSKIKFSIENLNRSTDPNDNFGTFDLIIRDINDRDDDVVVLEQHRGINLNPQSDRYIAKVIGDIHAYYDFDKKETAQKLVIDGDYQNKSVYVRVEVSEDVKNEELEQTSLPVGFRGFAHLVTSGSAPLAAYTFSQLHYSTVLKQVSEAPVPYRYNITNGSGIKKSVNSSYYWGVQFEHVVSTTTVNSSVLQNQTIKNITKYLPDFKLDTQNMVVMDNEGVAVTSQNGVMDADLFNRNLFSLENIKVVTGSNTLVNNNKWADAVYVRGGNITADETAKTRAFTVADISQASKKYCKFSFIMQGGFDGVNIFDQNESEINNIAVTHDMQDSNRGLTNGPSVKSYTKALDVIKNTSIVDIQLLAVPGIRHESVTDEAIATAGDDRKDSLYIMDIEEYDTVNSLITSSVQIPHVQNTVTALSERALDSSYAAAYYPDQVLTDPNTNTNITVPPSVVVLGALSLNDRVGHPWFAPAGFTRGALEDVLEAKVKLNKENMDALAEASINPIVAFPGQSGNGANAGVVVWGQKTLQAAATALDRINVRRLLLAIRREVRIVANTFIFEPNLPITLARFESAVKPILERVQSQKGVEAFKVQIDASTTTELDVQNNTVRGKIYVVPTKTIEYVSIDFVLTNKGVEGT
jgi:phage tail sheath protein FI